MARIIAVSTAELRKRRADIVRRLGGDLDELRARSDKHAVTPDERDLLLELEEVDFLLGADA